MNALAAKPAVSAAVERFYVRVLADPMLAPFFDACRPRAPQEASVRIPVASAGRAATILRR